MTLAAFGYRAELAGAAGSPFLLDRARQHILPALPAAPLGSSGLGKVGVTAALSVTLYGSFVDWFGEAGVEVTATVLQEGVVVAITPGMTVSDAVGEARLRFRVASQALAGAFPRGFLVPGNEVVVIARGQEPLVVTLPRLAADMDPRTDQIAGRGPPLARVRVRLGGTTASAERLDEWVDVDAEGRFLLDLAGVLDVSPSDFGQVVLVDGGSNRIAGGIALPSVHLEVGRPAACGWNRDERLVVDVLDEAGRSKYGGCDDPRSESLEMGDLVVLHRGSGFLVPDSPPTETTRVPAFSVRFDPLTGRLTGEGPARSRLILAFGTAFRAAWLHDVTTDDLGRFGLDAVVGPGWSVYLTWDSGNGISISQAFGSATAFVGLGNGAAAAWVGSIVQDSRIDLTMIDAAGSPTAQVTFVEEGWSESPWQGDWNTALDADMPLAPRAGDALEISLDGTPPTQVVVPGLSASYDWPSQALSGTAPPGCEVIVTFAGDTANSPSRDPILAVPDSQGRFAVALSGGDPVGPDTWGLVAVESDAVPVVFYVVWSTGRLELDLLTGWLSGLANVGEAVTVSAQASGGGLRARGNGSTSGLLSLTGEPLRVPVRPRWSVSLATDWSTGRVDLAAGDEITTCAGRGCDTFRVPDLRVEGDPATDLLLGSTEPGAELDLTITRRPDGDPARSGASFFGRVTAGSDGRFEESLAGRFDLMRGDFVAARITSPAGHRVVRGIRLPCLDLDLDNGWLTGLPPDLEVGVPITVTLVREGEPRMIARGETGTPFAPAAYLVRLGGDTSIAPQAGDRLEVIIGSAAISLSMDVPRLEAVMDWPSGRLRGHWLGEGTLELHSGSIYGYPEPAADGSFDTVIVRPGVAGEPWAQPGRVAELQAFLDSGDTVRRRLVFPRASIEVGGARVDARVQPLADVTAELLDSQGAVIASAVGRAREYLTEGLEGDPSNNAFLTLHSAGEATAIEPGQRVRLSTADAEVIVSVPPLTAAADWGRGLVTGSGPPDSPFAWAVQSDRRCWLTDGYSWEFPEDSRIWRTGSPLSPVASGQFELGPMEFQPGKRYMVGLLTLEGHRVYRSVVRASAEIELAAGTVAGCAQPLSVVTAELQDEGGLRRATGQAPADADGRYRLALLNPAARPAAMQPTDALELCSGGECVVLRDAHVAVAWEGTEAIAGEATDGSAVWATWFPISPYAAAAYPQLESGLRPLWYPFVTRVKVDADGRFRVQADEVEAWRKPWRLPEVRAVHVSAELEPGRHAVAIATRTQPIYLPISHSGD